MVQQDWIDLSKYGIAIEAWEGVNATGETEYFLVALGNIDEHAEKLQSLGGQLVDVLDSPSVPVFYFEMFSESDADVVVGNWLKTFPEMAQVVVESSEILRTVDQQNHASVNAAIAKASAASAKISLDDVPAPKFIDRAPEPSAEFRAVAKTFLNLPAQLRPLQSPSANAAYAFLTSEDKKAVNKIFENASFGIFVGAPLQTSISERDVEGVTVNRSDYAFMLRANAQLTANGKAIFLLGPSSNGEAEASLTNAQDKAVFEKIYAQRGVTFHGLVDGAALGLEEGKKFQVIAVSADAPKVSMPNELSVFQSFNNVKASVLGEPLNERNESIAVTKPEGGVAAVRGAPTNDGGDRNVGELGEGGRLREEPNAGGVGANVPGAPAAAGGSGGAERANGSERVAAPGATLDAPGGGRGPGAGVAGDAAAAIREDGVRGRDGYIAGQPVHGDEAVPAGAGGSRRADDGLVDGARGQNGDQRKNDAQGAELANAGRANRDNSVESDRLIEQDVAEADLTKREENARQTGYVSVSKMTNQGTMIPIGIDDPVRRALQGIEKEVGSIDAYVAKELKMDDEVVSSFFGEQIDAIAMAIYQRQKSKGFVLGDMTGIGKGRVVAAMLRHSLVNGRTPIFITEKPNLFGDMLRDLSAVSADARVAFSPLVMNDGVTIKNEFGEPIMRSTERAVLDPILASAELGDFNCVFMTYSQINREGPKADFLRRLSENADLVIDEAHVATGESNIGDVIQGSVARAKSVMYSSATFAKSLDNIAIYSRTELGTHLNGLGSEFLRRGGDALQESITTMLASAGQYIRREHDYRKAEFETVLATETSVVDRLAMDSVSEILRALNEYELITNKVAKKVLPIYLNRTYGEDVDELGRHDERAWRASAVARQSTSIVYDNFLTAVKAQQTADVAVRELKNGTKPVIAVPITNESQIKEMLERASRTGDLASLSMRDIFDGEVEKALTVRLRHANSDTTVNFDLSAFDDTQFDQFEVSQADRKKLRDAKAKLAVLKGRIKNIPLSPIDYIMQRIRDAGFKVGEITGRSVGLDYSQGVPQAINLPASTPLRRSEVIRQFNDGSLNANGQIEVVDALVLNRAAAAGISLHQSADFADKRPRSMLIVRPERDINAHVQLMGRIFRANMIGSPKYVTILSDVPYETRIAATLRRKMASLTASTSADAEAHSSSDTLDLFNAIGDQACYHVVHADRALKDRVIKGRATYHTDPAYKEYFGMANKLFSLLCTFSCDEQEKISKAVSEKYSQLVAAELAAGRSVSSKKLAIGARLRNSYELDAGKLEATNDFEKSVVVETYEYTPSGAVKARTFAEVAKIIHATSEEYFNDFGAEPPHKVLTALIERQIESSAKSADLTPEQIASFTQRKEREKEAVVDLRNSLPKLGAPVSYIDASDVLFVSRNTPRTHAWFAGMRKPKGVFANNPMEWELQFYTFGPEGTTGIRRVSVKDYLSPEFGAITSTILRPFDSKDSRDYDAMIEGMRKPKTLTLLTGNLLEASAVAEKVGSGSAVSIKLADGSWVRGIRVNDEHVMNLVDQKCRLVHDPELIREAALERGSGLHFKRGRVFTGCYPNLNDRIDLPLRRDEFKYGELQAIEALGGVVQEGAADYAAIMIQNASQPGVFEEVMKICKQYHIAACFKNSVHTSQELRAKWDAKIAEHHSKLKQKARENSDDLSPSIG